MEAHDSHVTLKTLGKLVAISGRAGSGKSEVAYACKLRGFFPLKFAAPLKAMLEAFYEQVGLEKDEIDARLEGRLKEEPDPYLNGATPRWAMQTLGSEWGRTLISTNLWTSALMRRATRYLDAGCDIVIDDLRFPNEERVVRSLGGVIIHVSRPGVGPAEHESELFIPDADVVIDNDGDLQDFRRKVAAVLYTLA